MNIELELKTFKPEIIELLQEENALTTAYTKLIAGARIPFDGKELTIAQLSPYKIDPDRATRRPPTAPRVRLSAQTATSWTKFLTSSFQSAPRLPRRSARRVLLRSLTTVICAIAMPRRM